MSGNNNNTDNHDWRYVMRHFNGTICTVAPSQGIVCNTDGDRLHIVEGREVVVKRRFVCDNAYIVEKHRMGEVRPVRESTHNWTPAQFDSYEAFEPDGISWPYEGAVDGDGLPYGICPVCGFEIPKNWCATMKRWDLTTFDCCIGCVPGYKETWWPVLDKEE